MAKLKTLRRCKLFQPLGYRELAIIAAHAKEESAIPDKWIVQEGEKSSGLIIVKSGRAEISSKATGGDRVIVGPNDFFGELSFVNGETHRAVGAKSLERCEYIKIPAAAYRRLATEAPDVAGKIAQGVMEAISEKVLAAMADLGKE